MTKPRSPREGGYNLIELLIAIALLGVVLLSIISLFIWGRKNVYSGKQMTTAISIGTRALEDLAPLTKEDVYDVFDIEDDDTGTATLKFGWPQQTYTNAAVRSTNASLVTGYADIQKQSSTGPKFLDKWNTELYHDAAKTRPKLLDGAITIVMMPRTDPVNDPDQFGESSVLQMRVIVSWSENRRRREVILDSAKVN